MSSTEAERPDGEIDAGQFGRVASRSRRWAYAKPHLNTDSGP
jgi:hypothetical protein